MGVSVDNSFRGTSTRSVYVVSSSDGLNLIKRNMCEIDSPDGVPLTVRDILKSPGIEFKIFTH